MNSNSSIFVCDFLIASDISSICLKKVLSENKGLNVHLLLTCLDNSHNQGEETFQTFVLTPIIVTPAMNHLVLFSSTETMVTLISCFEKGDYDL